MRHSVTVGDRALVVRLSEGDYQALERVARSVGRRPSELANTWIRAGLAEDTPLATLRRDLRDVTSRLDDLELVLAQMVEEGSEEPSSRRASAKPSADRNEPAGRPKLHEEIISVLADAGRSLTSSEIAAAIRERGSFEPRSGRAVDTTMVSQRISHTKYRELFARDGKAIRLAR